MNARLVTVMIVSTFGLIVAFDAVTVRGIATGSLYVIPVMMAVGYRDRRAIFVIAAAALTLVPLGYVISPPQDGHPINSPLWNRGIAFFSVLMMSAVALVTHVWHRRMLEQSDEQRVVALLGKRGLTETSFKSFVDAACAAISAHYKTPYCKLLEYVPDERKVYLIAGTGWDDEIGKWSESVEPGTLSGVVLGGNKPLVMRDARNETRFKPPEIFAQKGIVSGVNALIRRPDGPPFGILEADATTANRFDGQDVYFLKAVANLIGDAIRRIETEDKLREQARTLQESNKELNEFAAVASHDLQEPLRKILAFSERLAPGEGGRQAEYVAKIRDAAERMSRLISDLLLFARLKEPAAPRPRQETVKLDAVVADALAEMEVRIAQSKASVVVGGLPAVKGNRFQLQQLFSNLLSNAIKYCCAGNGPPKVEIDAARSSDGAEIRVRDNGIGFPQDYAERIFEPFKRLHGKGVYEGTGMGLAICRKIVEQHGGTIRAESRPGEGSTFVIRFPRMALAEE